MDRYTDNFRFLTLQCGMPKKTTSPAPQFSLFALEAPEPPNPYKKPVEIIHSVPRANLSLVQRKLANAWLKNAVETTPDDEGMWTIKTSRMESDIGFDSKNRAHLIDASRALMSIVFEWDVFAPETKKKTEWNASVLFPEVQIRAEVIRYQISRQVLNQILAPEVYALIDLNILNKFRRASSLALYEHCFRFIRINRTTEVELGIFRNIILGEGADTGSYKEYKVFKDRVLKLVIAEINSVSDIRIELKETKVGRRVTYIWFTVAKAEQQLELPPVDDESKLHLVGEMVALGFTQAEAMKILTKHSAKDVADALVYTKQRITEGGGAKIKNPPAYLKKALTMGWRASGQDSAPSVAVEASEAKQGSGIDLESRYKLHQLKEAEAYFQELNHPEQQDLITEFNSLDISSSLKIKGSKPGKAAKVHFHSWLAERTWGNPTPEVLLEFAQKLLSNKE